MPIRPDKVNPGGLVLDYRLPNGTRLRYPCADRRQADRLLLDRAGPKSRRDLAAISMENALEWWLDRQKARGLDRISRTEVAAARLLSAFPGRKVSSVSAEEMRLFRVAQASGYRSRTLADMFGVMAQFFDEMQRRRCRRDNPARLANAGMYVKGGRGHKRREPKVSSYERLRTRATTEELLALDLLAQAAIGLTEGEALEHGRVDRVGRRIEIVALKDAHHRTAKTHLMPGRRRWVPTSERLRATMLRSAVLQQLMASREGRDMPALVHDSTVRHKQFKRILLKVGLTQAMTVPVEKRGKMSRSRFEGLKTKPLFTSNEFRHLAAVRWIDEGISGKALARRLGLKTTKAVYRIYYKELASRSKRRFIPLVDRGVERLHLIS